MHGASSTSIRDATILRRHDGEEIMTRWRCWWRAVISRHRHRNIAPTQHHRPITIVPSPSCHRAIIIVPSPSCHHHRAIVPSPSSHQHRTITIVPSPSCHRTITIVPSCYHINIVPSPSCHLAITILPSLVLVDESIAWWPSHNTIHCTQRRVHNWIRFSHT